MAKAPQPRRIGLDLDDKSLSALVLRPDGRLAAAQRTLDDEKGLQTAISALLGDPAGSEVVLTSSRGFSALRKPPRIALLVTAGFEDLLLLHDPPLAGLSPIFGAGLQAQELCPRERVIGVPERLFVDGSVEKPLTAAALEAIKKQVAALEVAAIAVVLLHSPQNDAHERTIAEALAPLGLPISLSSSVLRVLDERRRAGATLLDACLAVRHRDERAAIERKDRAAIERPDDFNLLYSDSAGDATLPDDARPLGQLFSSIAAGLRGAQRIAAGHGQSRFLTLHMLDAGAVVALHDPALSSVAPSGAGRGLEPWAELPVEELHVVSFDDDSNDAQREAAILAALEAITIDRGHDPAEYPLLAYGRLPASFGANLVEKLGAASLLVPPLPELVAAYGALCAPLVVSRRELVVTDASSAQQTGQIVATLSMTNRRLREELAQAGHATSPYLIGFEWLAEMRYRGQTGHTLLLTGLGDGSPAPSGDTDLVVRFCAEHQRRYGFVLPECPVEIVALRARVTLPVATPSYSELQRLKGFGDAS